MTSRDLEFPCHSTVAAIPCLHELTPIGRDQRLSALAMYGHTYNDTRAIKSYPTPLKAKGSILLVSLTRVAKWPTRSHSSEYTNVHIPILDI